MTQEKILRLAFRQAVLVWGEYKDRADRLPGNKIAARNEQRNGRKSKSLKRCLRKSRKLNKS